MGILKVRRRLPLEAGSFKSGRKGAVYPGGDGMRAGLKPALTLNISLPVLKGPEASTALSGRRRVESRGGRTAKTVIPS